MLTAAFLLLTACGPEESGSSISENANGSPDTGVTSPFAFKGATVRAANGAVIGIVADIVLNPDQETFAVVVPESGSTRRVVATAALTLDDGTARLTEGRTADNLPPYDPAEFQPMGRRVKP